MNILKPDPGELENKILIVDDTAANIFALEKILKRLPVTIYKATSGEEALSLVLRHRFFLVLLDMYMPTMDGFETASLMREHEETQHVPIIFVTAMNKDERNFTHGYETGAVDYLYKPIDVDLLLSKVNVFLNLDIQRHQLEVEIADRIKAENTTNEFLSVVSHELRTPMTAINGSLGLLEGNAFGELEGKAMEMVQLARKNCERLLVLIDDLLDSQKLEAGKMEFVLKPVSLLALVNDAVDSNQGYAHRFNVEFLVEATSYAFVVNVDYNRIIQVMNNLLSNAAKFSPPQSKIHITMIPHKITQVRVGVQDHGHGVSEEFAVRIFEKFSQAPVAKQQSSKGTGLGLNISKSIIEHHKGHIGFCSKEGEGSTFFFDLPVYDEQKLSADDSVS